MADGVAAEAFDVAPHDTRRALDIAGLDALDEFAVLAQDGHAARPRNVEAAGDRPQDLAVLEPGVDSLAIVVAIVNDAVKPVSKTLWAPGSAKFNVSISAWMSSICLMSASVTMPTNQRVRCGSIRASIS